MTKKRINIFGTTGSIGQNTLQVFRNDRQKYEFIVFSAYENVDQFIKDCLNLGRNMQILETKKII